jgi:hypothetical protein
VIADRDEPSGRAVDPDDWFAGASPDLTDEPGERTGGAAAAGEPGWLEDVAEPEAKPAPRTVRFPAGSRGRLVAAGAAAIALILIGLAASGVFSGNGSAPSPAPTTASQATTTAPAPATTPTQSNAPTTLPASVLKPGATGEEVKTLQRALGSAGHSPGPIDGVYGPKTEQAVSDFQRSAAITVDGVYGPQTKQALEQSLASG